MHNIVQVQVHVKPESVDAFIAASRENARQSRLESGIARFEVYQQKDDPTRFVFLEAFLTPEAPAAHRESAHYKIWRDTVAGMMAEPRRGVNLAEV
jgi:(4S)-4-hydroxy-5-phosphonooxypentane-2,3-dione isomerase